MTVVRTPAAQGQAAAALAKLTQQRMESAKKAGTAADAAKAKRR